MSDAAAVQILELVQLMRADVSPLKDQVSTVLSDVLQIGPQLAMVAETSARHAIEIASIAVRLDRIEKRLELWD